VTGCGAAKRRLRAKQPTPRRGTPRRRAPGAGPPHRHDDRHRLLMALVWLRVYPTYELLGFLFGLHKRNAQLNVRAVLAVLDTLETSRSTAPAATARSSAPPPRSWPPSRRSGSSSTARSSACTGPAVTTPSSRITPGR